MEYDDEGDVFTAVQDITPDTTSDLPTNVVLYFQGHTLVPEAVSAAVALTTIADEKIAIPGKICKDNMAVCFETT